MIIKIKMLSLPEVLDLKEADILFIYQINEVILCKNCINPRTAKK